MTSLVLNCIIIVLLLLQNLENRHNLNFKLDSKAGSMRYTPHVQLSFLSEQSVGDPRDLNVTVPNLALLSLTTMMSSYSFIRLGFNVVINQVNATSTVNLPVHDYLWGYKDPLISLASTYMPHWIDFDTMGLLDRIYDQKNSRELILRSRKADQLQIKTMDGMAGLSVWDYENPSKRTRCNTFVDVYEGMLYPNDMSAERPARIYRTALCRFLDLEHVGTVATPYGCDALVLQIKNNSFAVNEDNKCLCSRGLCVDGLSDISPCYYGLPLAVSNAHFTGADPALTSRIEGLTPDPERFTSRFLIEPILGIALGTDFWIQVNLVVGDIRYNRVGSPFADMVIPIISLRITQPPVRQDLKNKLIATFLTVPRVCLAITILLSLTGLALLAYSTWLIYYKLLYSGGKGFPVLILRRKKKKAAVLNDDVEIPLASDSRKLT